MDDEVLLFISRFTNNGKLDQVKHCFTNGCCYWFAYILCKRFNVDTIMYDPIDGHFGTYINGKVYDITGDVTKGHKWISWEWICNNEPNMLKRITNDCINF